MFTTGNTSKKTLTTSQMPLGLILYFDMLPKAFICKALVKELSDKGWGVDVVSGGEMATVQAVTGSLRKYFI
jgi:hypothetical protein